MKYKFILDCIPSAQARARHAVRNGLAMAYKDKKQKRNEVELDSLIRQFKPDKASELPICIYIKCFLPIPLSISKKKHEILAQEKTPVSKKPDLDNYVKNILDCMTRASFWRDDSQICVISASKTYSEKPRWEIEYYEVEG